MEIDGKPMRSVILTSWRSGSTFLGDVVNAHPANFYHYEPLLDYGIVQIREPPLADESLIRVVSLLKCEFKELGNFIDIFNLVVMWNNSIQFVCTRYHNCYRSVPELWQDSSLGLQSQHTLVAAMPGAQTYLLGSTLRFQVLPIISIPIDETRAVEAACGGKAFSRRRVINSEKHLRREKRSKDV